MVPALPKLEGNKTNSGQAGALGRIELSSLTLHDATMNAPRQAMLIADEHTSECDETLDGNMDP